VSAGTQPSGDTIREIADLGTILDHFLVVARGLGPKRFSPAIDLTIQLLGVGHLDDRDNPGVGLFGQPVD
jgi:hypothetical protein